MNRCTPGRRPAILFLCTGNSCRSQMAEGWLRRFGGDQVVALSAGIEAHGLNPFAVRVMAERGIDIGKQRSKRVTHTLINTADRIVTLCGHADEHCPVVPATVLREHWPILDPAQASGTEAEVLAVYRGVRDEIEQKVHDLLVRMALVAAGLPDDHY
jgi:arsenate reductase